MRKGILYCLLPAVTGLALILVAVLLSSSSVGGPTVPSVQAADGQECHFTIHKEEVDEDEVEFDHLLTLGTVNDGFDDDDIFYEITITNQGPEECGGQGSALDVIEGGECVFADFLDVPQDIQVNIYGCGLESAGAIIDGEDGIDVVTFMGVGSLEAGEEALLLVVVEPDEEFGCVEDTACLVEAVGGSEVTGSRLDQGPCDEATIKDTELTCHRRHVNTPTPTPKPTSTPAPTNTPKPPAPTPTVKPLATIAPPPTGSGSSEGGWSPLTLALAAMGGCLLLASGGAMAKRRIG
jgi:cell division septation protein DedD